MSLTEEMVVESLKGMIDPNTGKNLIETKCNKSILFFDVVSNSPWDNKKSPTKTAILFFHRALIDKNPLLSEASSTTSSWTRVAVCNNSIKDAAI